MLIPEIEAQATYILHAIDRYRTEPIHSFAPTSAAETDFTAHVTQFMQRSVYADKCRSGHKGHTIAGRTPTLWPGSTLHYLQAMREFRGEDWDVRYNGNRFAYLGNGVSHAEFDPTSDLAYYLREEDEGETVTRREVMKEVYRTGSQPERMLHFTYRPDVINLPEKRRKVVEGRVRKSWGGVRVWERLMSVLGWPVHKVEGVMKRVLKCMRWIEE